uniref:Cytochrome oxidase subunit III n=1 Tax=Heterorhabditis bacteriophora TaxID=37862 RepID=A0A1I7W8W5_HETBA
MTSFGNAAVDIDMVCYFFVFG